MFRSSKVTRAWTVVLASQFVLLSFGPGATCAFADDMPSGEAAPSWNDSSKSAASAILDKPAPGKTSSQALVDTAKRTTVMPLGLSTHNDEPAEKPNFTLPPKASVAPVDASAAVPKTETKAESKAAPIVTNPQVEEETPASRAAAKAALRAEEKVKADAARVVERERAKSDLAAQAEAKAKVREEARAEAEKIAKEREDAKAKERAETLAKAEAEEKGKVAAREARDKERAEAKAKKEAEKVAKEEAEKKDEEAKKVAEAKEESEKKAAKAKEDEAKKTAEAEKQKSKAESKQAKAESKPEIKSEAAPQVKPESKVEVKTETKAEAETPAEIKTEEKSEAKLKEEHGKAIAEVNKAVPAEASGAVDTAAVMSPIPSVPAAQPADASAPSEKAVSDKPAPQVGSGGTLGTADSLSSEMLKSLGAAPTVAETETVTVDANGVVQEGSILVVDCDEKSEVEEEIKYENLETDEGKTHIKTGARFPVVVSSQISSKTAKKGDPVEARLKYDLKIGDRLIAHKGAEVHGHINYTLKARSAMHSLVSPERWYRNSGVLGVEFDEIINDKGEHLPLVAMPARTSRIVKNKYEGRVLGVNHLGQVAGPLSQQIRYKAIRVGLNAAMAPAGVFSFGAMPVALGLIGAANPSFAFMKPVGQNVRHRRIKGFAWGFLSGVPGSWLIEDTVIKGQESIIKPGDEFLAEFHQDFNGEPATEAQLLPNATVKVHGDVRPTKEKDKDKAHK